MGIFARQMRDQYTPARTSETLDEEFPKKPKIWMAPHREERQAIVASIAKLAPKGGNPRNEHRPGMGTTNEMAYRAIAARKANVFVVVMNAMYEHRTN